jgi:hypothetical protein
MNNIKIVQFNDGNFGIRRTSKLLWLFPCYEYLCNFNHDRTAIHWVTSERQILQYCRYRTKKEAENQLAWYKKVSVLPDLDKGTPV